MKSFRPLIALIWIVGLAGAQTPEFSISPESAQRDATLLIQVMRDLHPGYARYRPAGEVELAEQELLAAASRCTQLTQFYLNVSRFLAKIRCEHTEAELPIAIADYRKTHGTMLPVDFAWVDGTAIITGVAPGLTGVEYGDELLKVNEHTISELFSAMAPSISVDGCTDHTKGAIFAGTDDIGLTTFDVLFPCLHGFTDTFQLTIRSPDGEQRLVTLPGNETRCGNSPVRLGYPCGTRSRIGICNSISLSLES